MDFVTSRVRVLKRIQGLRLSQTSTNRNTVRVLRVLDRLRVFGAKAAVKCMRSLFFLWSLNEFVYPRIAIGSSWRGTDDGPIVSERRKSHRNGNHTLTSDRVLRFVRPEAGHLSHRMPRHSLQ